MSQATFNLTILLLGAAFLVMAAFHMGYRDGEVMAGIVQIVGGSLSLWSRAPSRGPRF